MREKYINEILDFSGDEFGREELIQLAKEKDYQLRIKDNSRNYYSYIKTFSTNGEWQEIVIPLKEMYPSFRGRRLDVPNFSHDYIEEIVFLIGNKKNENFELIIDKIVLK